ncbi:MAG TPA: tRNA (cytidine(34)-2'-O)-methyltransferase [Usitatibacter sp.]|nr:tRNA (cytidine(34)-2'-O)-methyltransferase [Usitatibacter sp.]
MFEVVLFQPEIPPNTGNVIRLCANTGSRLHLVEPLGYSLEDKQLKRAGLDYHDLARVEVHPDWKACVSRLGNARRFAFTTRSGVRYTDVAFRPGDAFVFGPEAAGLPDAVLEEFPLPNRLCLPMYPGNRSLNLSNAVAVAVFEAWRQAGFMGSVTQPGAL